MVDLSHIPVRTFESTDQYNYVIDNRPINDLNARIVAVNGGLQVLSDEIVAARGDFPTLDERISVALEDDGTLKAAAFPSSILASQIGDDASVPQSDPEYGDKKVIMLLAERDKLSQVESQANRLTLKINDSESFSGNVRVITGKTIRMSRLPSATGDEVVFIDTIFPHDRLHEHRYHQIITDYSNGVAMFPNLEDNAIPGSIRVFLNGQQLRRSQYEEGVDASTGKRNYITIKEGASDIALIQDDMWVEYEVRPTWDSLVSDPLFSGVGIPNRFIHTLSANPGADFRSVPIGSNAFSFWLIDITNLDLVEPYDKFMLFVSESAWPPSAAPRGRTMRRYGQEWDIVTQGSSVYLRWRYDVVGTSGTPGTPDSGDDTYAWLTESGSGSEDEPNYKFAPANLGGGEHIDLVYYEPVV